MTSNAVAPLTYGVELEFCIKFLPLRTQSSKKGRRGSAAPAPDHEPHDPRPAAWKEDMENVPKFGEIDMGPKLIARIASAFEEHNIPYFAEIDDGELVERFRGLGDLDKWALGFDPSVTEDEDADRRYEYEGIELAGPIYYASNEKGMGLDEVRKVIAIIRNNFRTLVPAAIAGLHVHVGNGNLGFTSIHMMNLLSIVHVFEKQIDVIHPYRSWVEGDSKEAEYQNAKLMEYYRTPSLCYLGKELGARDESRPEYSQALRFLRREVEEELPKEVQKDHFQIRELFASGPEAMNGKGQTKINANKPGAIAQDLFASNRIAIPALTDLDAPEFLGATLYNHLATNLKQDLDPKIITLLQKPAAQLPEIAAAAEASVQTRNLIDPTLLLAPKFLSMNSNTMADLNTIAGCEYRSAYNIWGLAGKASDKDRKTIEFRQHQGTLDADKVVAWIQMVTGLVEWTRSATPLQITELLKIGGTRDPGEFDVVDLLRYMGLDEPADYYEREFFEVLGAGEEISPSPPSLASSSSSSS